MKKLILITLDKELHSKYKKKLKEEGYGTASEHLREVMRWTAKYGAERPVGMIDRKKVERKQLMVGVPKDLYKKYKEELENAGWQIMSEHLRMKIREFVEGK